MTTKLPLVLAGLYGAAGVALMAAGSHAAGGGFATTAGQMLLFHAPAVVAAVLARDAGLLAPGLGRAAIYVLLAGPAIFSADLTLRTFGLAARLFPMAAPTGGSLTILGWFLLAAAAGMASRRE